MIVATFESRLRSTVGRFDLASGRLTALRQLPPIGEAGVTDRRGLTASRDATIVAETEVRMLGHLYLVEARRS